MAQTARSGIHGCKRQVERSTEPTRPSPDNFGKRVLPINWVPQRPCRFRSLYPDMLGRIDRAASIPSIYMCRRWRTTASVQCRRDMVGPPDPVSNLRPVVYSWTPTRMQDHHYSADEFPAFTEHTKQGYERMDIEWNIARGRLDAFNHSFWAEVRLV